MSFSAKLNERNDPITIHQEGDTLMASVEYKVYRSESGWTGWVSDGDTAGNLNAAEDDFIRKIQVRLLDAPDETEVIYTVHLTGGLGWMGWVSGDQKCGSTEEGVYIDMVSIDLLNNSGNLSISYHVYTDQDGWKGWTSDGRNSGSTACRLKGIEIKIKE
jgi:uncharacterized protein YjdB